jgi:hypothetical protein
MSAALPPASSASPPISKGIPNRIHRVCDTEMLLVFRLIPFEELKSSLSRVCRRWNALIDHNTRSRRKEIVIRRLVERLLVRFRSPTVNPPGREWGTLHVLDARIEKLEKYISCSGYSVDQVETIQRSLEAYRFSRMLNHQLQMPVHIFERVAQYVSGPPKPLQFIPRCPAAGVIPIAQWNQYVVATSKGRIDRSLLARMSEDCSVFPGKKVGETHILLDIPPEIRKFPETFKQFAAKALKPLEGNPVDCYFEAAVGRVLEETAIPYEPFLLLKTYLPGTNSRSLSEARKILSERYPKYRQATLMEVVAPSLLEFIRSSRALTRLFLNECALTSTPSGKEFLVYTWADHTRRPFIFGHPAASYWHEKMGLAVVLK